MTERVKSRLNIVTEVTNGVVYTVKSVCNRVVKSVCAVGNAVCLLVKLRYKCLLVNCGSDICLCSTRCSVAAAKSISKSSAPTKEKQDDNPNLLS